MRAVLGGLGVAVTAYGGWLLVGRTDTGQLVEAAIWLASGVLLHDVVLTAAVLVLAAVALRLPDPARAPAVVGLVVLGSLTLVAVPMLGRFGARDDNPTLLDRPYLESWLVLVGITVVAVAAVSLVRSRQRPRQGQED
ncbi:MAG: hypothetical protein M3237_20490 [Actinomycetota bacterium]|nr:hypothetical protein [Actinomycetota bacterium]